MKPNWPQQSAYFIWLVQCIGQSQFIYLTLFTLDILGFVNSQTQYAQTLPAIGSDKGVFKLTADTLIIKIRHEDEEQVHWDKLKEGN